MTRKKLHRHSESPRIGFVILALVFGSIGIATLQFSRASIGTVGLEAESGQLVNAQALPTSGDTSQGAVRLHAQEVIDGGYDQNLALLRAAVGTRNDDFRNSLFRYIPSDQLDIASLTDPVGIDSGYYPDPIGGSFRTVCYFSHLAYDDPILFPGKPGVSHLHMFFGNDEANAFSTTDTIINRGSSTCHGHELNRTGYWVPAVFDAAGNVRIPDRMFVYYKSFGATSNQTQVYPKDKSLRIIAGKSTAESPQDFVNVIQWVCGGRTNADRQPTIPSCGEGGLTGNVKFPQCWNGQAGWTDGVAHMSLPTGGYYAGDCPLSHPYLMPSIEIFLEYDSTPGGTDGWYVSSDVRPDGSAKTGGITYHGDWWDGWNAQVNQAWVSKCTGAFYNCGLVSHIGDNRTLKGWEGTAIQLPAGQPDYNGVRVIAPDKIALLCPGDTFAMPTDSAWCQTKLATADEQVMQLHAQMGHVSSVSNNHAGH